MAFARAAVRSFVRGMRTWFRIADEHPHKAILLRLQTIFLLTLTFLSTLLLEMLYNSLLQSFPKTTLLEYLQSSTTFTTLIYSILTVCIFLALLIGTMTIAADDGVIIVYVSLLKLFEFIPPLIDVLNLFFVYQHKIMFVNDLKHNEQSMSTTLISDLRSTQSTYPSTRLVLSLIFALSRFLLSIHSARQRSDRKWKRRPFIICDLALFVLVTVTLLRYSTINPLRIGRKMILAILLFKLNDLVSNKPFWIAVTNWKRQIRWSHSSTLPMKLIASVLRLFRIQVQFPHLIILRFILFARWMIASSMICLFAVYVIQSVIVSPHHTLFTGSVIFLLLESYVFIPVVSLLLLALVGWDALQGWCALDQRGIVWFCTGIDALPAWRSNETLPDAQLRPGVLVSDDAQPPFASKQHKQQTCQVCFDDKASSQFGFPLTIHCRHTNRSICDTCVFRHVQQAFQVTFTDDVHCPELACGVKLDYDAVRHILLFNGDEKVLERYDRFTLHRQLEQMDEFIWCSNPTCQAGQLNDGGVIVTCIKCRQRTCFTHKVKWHEGLTCQEYDLGMDADYEASRRWIVANSKKCPKCPFQIEKDKGCDHMTCIKCRHEFCWSCLVDYELIRRHGNQRHDRNCKHYAPYDEDLR